MAFVVLLLRNNALAVMATRFGFVASQGGRSFDFLRPSPSDSKGYASLSQKQLVLAASLAGCYPRHQLQELVR
jgi:hypothetical protein